MNLYDITAKDDYDWIKLNESSCIIVLIPVIAYPSLLTHLMLPADGPSSLVVNTKPERDHRGVGHRAVIRKVLALVQHIVVGEFSAIRGDRLKLAR